MTRAVMALLLAASVPILAAAQGRGAPAPRSPKDAAPIDLSGNWVSLVTEDWRWRMVTPLKGDSASVPINQAAKKIVNAWDPAKDEAAGLQCKSYGAPAIMRVPGRLRITWQDDTTLKIETDAGMQTRLLHFGPSTLRQVQGRPELSRGATGSGPSRAESRDDGKPPAGEAPSWQGYSLAKWEEPPPIPNGLPIGLGPRQGLRSRSLEVKTTNLRAGYLRKNGVPYSARTTVTEYFERFSEPNGDEHLMVMTIVTDPEYLAVPFVTTSDFKKEADGSKWDPSPCTAR